MFKEIFWKYKCKNNNNNNKNNNNKNNNIYIYIYIYRQNKCDTPNDELPVEGSKKGTVLQLQILDEYRARKHEAEKKRYNI